MLTPSRSAFLCLSLSLAFSLSLSLCFSLSHTHPEIADVASIADTTVNVAYKVHLSLLFSLSVCLIVLSLSLTVRIAFKILYKHRIRLVSVEYVPQEKIAALQE